MLNRNRRSQHGLSVVEIMVGMAVGLFVAAAAAMVVSSQLSSNRRLLLDTQLQQDLRVAADIVTRDLRRAGALLDTWALRSVWYPQSSVVTPVTPNPAAPALTTTNSPVAIQYQYHRKVTGTLESYGFRIDGDRLQSRNGATWQDLTDPSVMTVTSLTITPESSTAVQLPCPNDCPLPAGGQACWPTLTVREFTVEIAARAANDATIQRSVRTRVRVANDLVTNNTGAANRICPL